MAKARIKTRESVQSSAAMSKREDADTVEPSEADEAIAERINYGSLPSLVGYRLRKAYGHLFVTFNNMLSELGLAPGQYSLLLLIGLNPGLSQAALAEATGIDRSTIVPIANRFVKLGWMRRVRRKNDRRAYALRLTPLGQDILNRAQPIIAAHEEALVAGLSDAERTQLVDMLARISEPQAA